MSVASIIRCAIGRTNATVCRDRFRLFTTHLANTNLTTTGVTSGQSEHTPAVGVKSESSSDNKHDVNPARANIQHIFELLRQHKSPQRISDSFRSTLMNPNLNKQSDAIDKEILSMAPQELIHTARMLLSVIPVDTHLIKSMELQMMWLMKKMTAHQLYKVLEAHRKFGSTPLRQQVYNEAVGAIGRRWVEISNPKDLVSLFYFLENSNDAEQYINNLENRAIDLMPEMRIIDMYRILYSLGRRQKRNTALLQSLCYHMNKQSLTLDTQQLVNSIFSLARVTFVHVGLLSTLSTHLVQRGNDLTSDQAFSLLKSINILQWCYEPLLDTVSDVLTADLNSTNAVHLTSLVTTCGKLGYLPSSLKVNLAEVAPILNDLKDENPDLWVNVVWAFSVLELMTGDMAQSVLGQEFQARINAEEHINPLTELRLIDIEASAKLDLEGCQVPTLETGSAQVPSRTDTSLLMDVWEILDKVYPAEKFLQRGDMKLGHEQDIYMCVNKDGEPLKLSDVSDTILSDDNFRVIIKVMDFGDVTQPLQKPLGHHQQIARHLTKLGHTVVHIMYSQYPSKDSTLARTRFIKEQIKSAIAK